MTRKELFIREQAALSAYRDNDIDRGVDYMVQLLDRNKEMKFYRFRPVRQHEIDAIENAQIYLCRPKIYEDTGDCKWIDDLEALVEYDGEFHYNKHFKSRDELSLIKQSNRDAIKADFAKKNKIKLIRIPYWEFENINRILNKELRGVV